MDVSRKTLPISTLILILSVSVRLCQTEQKLCTTPNGEQAQCVSLYSCHTFLSAIRITAVLNEETRKFMEQSKCGCFEVCCGSSVKFEQPKVRPNWKPLASRKICGRQHTDDRGYGGNVTAIDEFPWTVQLLYNNTNGKIKDKCAGILINRRYILTAAYCVASSETVYKIRLGEYDKQNDTDCTIDYPDCADPVIDLNVENVTVHHEFLPASGQRNHGIALVRLSENVPFSDYIRPICLPTYGHKNATDGDMVTLTGWGTLAYGRPSRIKKRVLNEVVSLDECSNYYKNVSNAPNIDKYMLCTKEDNDNTSCDGDGGGPVMSKTNVMQWQLEGIIYAGVRGRCGSGSIAMNLRVSEYMDWILENIKPF